MSPSPVDVRRRWEHELRSALVEARLAPAPVPDDGEWDPAATLRVQTVGGPCPARSFAEAREDYPGESAARVARRVGLAAMQHEGTALDRVRAALDSPESFGGKLPDWLRGLAPAARASVEAVALAWVVDALALGGAGYDTQWSNRGLRWSDPDLDVILMGAFDARRGHQSSPRLLLIRQRPEGRDEQAARFVALLHALAVGAVPERISFGYRGSLDRRHLEMGADSLDVAVEEVVIHERWRRDGGAPEVPGSGCAHCSFVGGCTPGEAALSARDAIWSGRGSGEGEGDVQSPEVSGSAPEADPTM